MGDLEYDDTSLVEMRDKLNKLIAEVGEVAARRVACVVSDSRSGEVDRLGGPYLSEVTGNEEAGDVIDMEKGQRLAVFTHG